jgi:Leucine-rich repeat (LRR) protein
VKTRANLCIACSLVWTLLSGIAVQAGPADPAYIPDANLKQAIKTALGLTRNPTESDMLYLTLLQCGGKSVADLTGLQYATNLTRIEAYSDKIVDLSPLAGLTKLTYLELMSNKIVDLSALSGLTSLTYLHLGDNQIVDISTLAGLTKLTDLSLWGNRVSDITALSGLGNLMYLAIAGDPVEDLSPLSGLTGLVQLSVGSNDRASDLSPLSGLTNLTYLSVGNIQGGDISALSALTHLTELYAGSQISDLRPLSGLTRLSVLNLLGNKISDIGPLSGLTTLTHLNLSYNQIMDISALSGMTRLTELNVTGNRITDITSLAGTTSLTRLYADQNRIVDLSPLAGLTKLAWVYLSTNQIADISPFYGMASVTQLGVSSNQVSDISVVSSLTNLTNLDVSQDRASDLSPLANLRKLQYLALGDNPWNAQACTVYMPIIKANNPGVRIEGNPCCTPVITQHPQSQTVSVGGSVTFTVAASGQTPFSYRWTKGGLNISGATSSSYTLNPVGAGDAGSYACTVANTCGNAISDTATLTVVAPHTLTTSSGDGGSVTTPGEGAFTYGHGTLVTVVATADPGYHFVNWTGTAVDAGDVTDPTSASTTVRMHNNFTLVANFALDRLTLTLSSTDGGAVTLPGEGSFIYGHGTTVSVTATAETGYHFVSWSGTAVTTGHLPNAGVASTTVLMHGNFTLVANFALNPQVTLTASSGEGGAVATPGEGGFSYGTGTAVAAVAAAEPHHRFVGWTGTAVTAGKVADPSSASTTVTMDASYTLIANFALDTYSLTITGANGAVGRDPAKAAYAYGETVTLQATANTHYHFSGWSGDVSGAANPATITMDGDKTVVAVFAPNRWSLTISCTAGGTVVSPGEGTFQYDEASSMMLEARAEPLFRFVGWQGSLSASSNPYSLTMDADYSIKACFQSVLDELVVVGVLPGDTQEDGTTSHPFKGIQEAIDVAKDGAKLTIRPGTYAETIDLSGKAIELNGLSGDPNKITPLPVIDGQGKGTVIRCVQGEDANCAIVGLVITGGSGNLAGGILCAGSSPTIQNCLIVGNRATGPDGVGGGLYCQDSSATIVNCTITGNYGGSAGAGVSFKDSQAVVVNSIIWGNGPSEIQAAGTVQPVIGYTDVAGGWIGMGNLNADPLFAAAGYWANPADLTSPVSASVSAAVWVAGDYHVKSQAGRWSSVLGQWVKDVVMSPCIDSGNPASPAGIEPSPNGNRVNLGTFGGTNQASLTKP